MVEFEDAASADQGVDYPPLSALNDYLFCPRRCALHRLEGIWVENIHTASGSIDHQRVHTPHDDAEEGCRTARGLRLISHVLRIQGVSDLVEFHPAPDSGREIPFPVEYKRGKRRRWDNDDVQLCAQAMCLEEMIGVAVPCGAVYHVLSRRRRNVIFDEALRELTISTANRLHLLLRAPVIPTPVVTPRCRQCSLYRLCLPELIADQSAYRTAATDLFRNT